MITATEQVFIGAKWDENHSFFISGMAFLVDIAPVSKERTFVEGITT